MLVISDASPLNVLIRLSLVDILPELYRGVVIPSEVRRELEDAAAPELVRAFMARPPTWLETRTPGSLLTLSNLGPGESAAISLALETNADLLLVDDKQGRRAAQALGIRITGTLGILENAAGKGLLDFPAAVQRLRQTDFKIAERLLEEALRRNADRAGRPDPP